MAQPVGRNQTRSSTQGFFTTEGAEDTERPMDEGGRSWKAGFAGCGLGREERVVSHSDPNPLLLLRPLRALRLCGEILDRPAQATFAS